MPLLASPVAEPESAERPSHEQVAALPTAAEFIFRVHAPGVPQRLVRIKTPKCAIGSRTDCTLRLKGQGVAPVNCLLTRDEQGASIRRMAGDVRVNGLEIQQARLNFGEELSVGRFRFELLNEAMLARPVAPAPPSGAAPETKEEPVSRQSAIPAVEAPGVEALAAEASVAEALAPPAAVEPAAADVPSAAVDEWRALSGDPQAMRNVAAVLAEVDPATKQEVEAVQAVQARLAAEFVAASSKFDELWQVAERRHEEELAWRAEFTAWRTEQSRQTGDLAARCDDLARVVERLAAAVEDLAIGPGFSSSDPSAAVADHAASEAAEWSEPGNAGLKQPVESSFHAESGLDESTEPSVAVADAADEAADATDIEENERASLGTGLEQRPLSVRDSHADFVAALDASRRAEKDPPAGEAGPTTAAAGVASARAAEEPSFAPVSDAAPVSTASLFGRQLSEEPRPVPQRPMPARQPAAQGGPDDRPVYNPWRGGGFHATPDVPFRKHEAGGAMTPEEEHDRAVREYVAGLVRRSGGSSPEGDAATDGDGEQPYSSVEQSAAWGEPKVLARRAPVSGRNAATESTISEVPATAIDGQTDEPVGERELRPRAKAPEQQIDMAAMRELARDNAKAALDTHALKQRAERVQVWLIGSLASLALSFVFMWLSTSGNALHYGGAVLFLAAAVGFGLRYLTLAKKEEDKQQPPSPQGTSVPVGAGQVQKATAEDAATV